MLLCVGRHMLLCVAGICCCVWQAHAAVCGRHMLLCVARHMLLCVARHMLLCVAGTCCCVCC